MAKLPTQPENLGTPKSLQINIDSEDDAKAVIQHLQLIKRTWDTMHDANLVDSIEFCIAEAIRRKVDDRLMTAVRWCRTYMKSVAPFEGNVFFSLPHYVPPSVVVTKTESQPTAPPAPAPESPSPANETPDLLSAQPKTPGKSKRLVTAETAGT